LVTWLDTDGLDTEVTEPELANEPELASEPELESSLVRSPEAHATPTSNRAAATAVNTPNIFLIITNLLGWFPVASVRDVGS
jgi:hypothetical protein